MTDHATSAPRRAMVLAAGLGTRMRPFTDQMPKPLVKVGGKALIDYVLDRLADAGVERAVVNVHHLADQIERHLAARSGRRSSSRTSAASCSAPAAAWSRRCRELGDGAVLPRQFRHHLDRRRDAQSDAARRCLRSRRAWTRCCCSRRPRPASAMPGRGDFAMAPDGRLDARGEREVVPFVYAGAAILTPAFFAGVPAGRVSMSPLFDRAIESGTALRLAAGRALDACRHPGRGRRRRSRHPGQRSVRNSPKARVSWLRPLPLRERAAQCFNRFEGGEGCRT